MAEDADTWVRAELREQLVALMPREVVGRRVGDVYHNDPALMAPINRALGGETVQAATHSGDLYFDVQYAPVFRDGRVSHILGLAIDDTPRSLAAQALEESESRFQNIGENLPVGMHLHTLDDRDRLMFQGFNPAAQTILGIDCSQFAGKTIEEAFPPLADTEIPRRYREAARDGTGGKTAHVEYDGGKIKGACQVHAIGITPGTMCALFLDIRDDLRQQQEIRDLNAGLERKVAERELAQAENMSSLGRLVAGVAHEINTPPGISVTDGSFPKEQVATLARQFREGTLSRGSMEDFLDRMARTCDSLESNLSRAARLVESFKSVAADRSSQQRRVFAVGETLADVLASLHNRLHHAGVTVESSCPEGLMLDNHPGPFGQVLTILIMNSMAHASPPGRGLQFTLHLPDLAHRT